MRKKHRFAQFLYDTKVLEILASTGGDSLTIFNYHRIRPDDPGFTTLFEEDVFGPTASQFSQQMQWLKKYRRVLSEDELIESMAGKPSALRKCVLVTFDDGYRDNFTLAYPILRELGIPAIFFIPTHLINTRQLGWWDMIAYLLRHSQKTTIDFAGQQLSLRHQRGQVARFLTQRMKLEKYEETHDVITQLAEATDVPLPPLAWQDNELMTWDQIREVSAHCVSIGSHTHTHRVLATLKEEIQLEELALSKTILERELGKAVRSIAYPVGGSRHFTQETQALAKRAGYELGFSYRTGPNENDRWTPFNIKRTTGPSLTSLVPAISVFPKLFGDHEDESRYQMEIVSQSSANERQE